MTEPLLRTENLVKSFDGVVANDGISFSVETGACHGLIGPNGSGKTTLFDLIHGVYQPDAGRVWFDGEDVTADKPDRLARKGLARTFQLVAPFEGLTVKQNLLGGYGCGTAGRIPAAKTDRAASILAELGLEHVADHKASDISGGQRRLLELGRALMLEPDCILLDEPTAGVNPTIQSRLLNHLETLNAQGTTLVIIEHDLAVVDALADHITVLDQGRIIAEGALADLKNDPTVREAYLGESKNVPSDLQATTGSVESPAAAPGRNRSAAPTDRSDQASGGSEPNRLVGTDIVTGYGNQTVLDGVSIRSHDGVTCVLGPNGSGKSTLLAALAGVLEVWDGTITFGGTEITGLNAHDRVDAGIAMVPQEEELFGSLSVRENLLLGGATVSDQTTVRHRLESVLDTFPPLERSRSEAARSLSGGQQVMLGVARAMMTEPAVYLLDEPLSGLSPVAVESVMGVIEALSERGSQVILVEQQVRDALDLADHAYILAQGRIEFDGRPRDLSDEDELVDLYLGLR